MPERLLSIAPMGRNSLAIIIDFPKPPDGDSRRVAGDIMARIERDHHASVRFIKQWDDRFGIRLYGDDENPQMCESFRLEWGENE